MILSGQNLILLSDTGKPKDTLLTAAAGLNRGDGWSESETANLREQNAEHASS
jgi:hypothetical protein